MADLEQQKQELVNSVLANNAATRERISVYDLPELNDGVVSSAFMTNNAAVDLIGYAARNIGLEDDPTFNPVQNFDKLSVGLPAEYHDAILHSTSQEEVNRIRETALTKQAAANRLAEAGMAGTAASLLAGVIDVDAPLAFLSDGTYLAAKLGVRSAGALRAARAVENGVMGAGCAMLTTVVQAAVNPEIDPAYIPQAGLAGLMFGATIGAALPTKQDLMRTAARQLDEYNVRLSERRADVSHKPFMSEDDTPIRFKSLAPEEENITPGSPVELKSGGAAVNTSRGPQYNKVDGFLNDKQEELIREAGDTLSYAGIKWKSMEYKSMWNKFEKWSGEKLGIDWYALSSSKSTLSAYITHLVLEAPTGRGGRRSTAAIDMQRMHDLMLDRMGDDAKAFAMWVDDTQPTPQGMFPGVQRHMQYRWNNDMRMEFDQTVHLEMNDRSLGKSNPNVHPAVKAAADAREVMAKTAFDLQKMAGVPGFEKLEYTPGYQPYKHLGERMIKAIQDGHTKEDIIALYSEGYKRANPGIDPRMADAMASSVVNRFTKREAGLDVSLYNILNADGRAFLLDGLLSNGIAKDEAVRLVDNWGGQLKEKGTIGHSKSRNELDLSVELNGLRLIDFLNSDYVSVWSHYAKGAAGEAALSKVGLGGRDARVQFRDAMIQEQLALGEKPMTREFIDDIFSYFSAGPVSGALGPVGQTIKKLASTNYLGKLGITQAGETGVSIAAIGFENYFAHDPVFNKLISEAKRGRVDGKLLEEMEIWAGRISQEHLLHRLPYSATEEMHSVNDVMDLVDKVNQFTGRALRLEMYMNGFYKIQQWQRARAMEGMATKVFKMMREGVTEKAGRRLDDIGLDASMQARLKKYIDDGTVEFLPNGVLDVLGMDKWDMKDAVDFANIMRRSTDQLVHRANIGEGGVWMHKGFASMLTHLQTFTLTSLHKQVFRNVNIMDDVTASMTVLGMITAGMGYATKQILDGRYENLDAKHLAVGAFSMSNMTGPVGTAAGMLGNMFGIGGGYGRGDTLLGSPALDWANRALHIPFAAARSVFGGVSKQDRHYLTALPFAAMVGHARVFDVLEDDDRAGR